MGTLNIKKTSIIATIPVLSLGLSWFLVLFKPYFLSFAFFLGYIALSLLILGVGWVKNFPKWTIHSISASVFMSLYSMNVYFRIFNLTEVLGIIALIPLFITLLIAVLFNFSFQPLKQLGNQIKEEKNVFFFLFYGIFPFIINVCFDEIYHLTVLICVAILTIIEVVTIVLYLESNSKRHRNLILVFGTLLPIVITVIGVIHLSGK